MSILEAVERIRRDHLSLPPAPPAALAQAHARGLPPDLLAFYSLTDGCYLWPGVDMCSPDGRTWRYRMSPLSHLRTVPGCGYLPPESELFQEAQSWLAIFELCDGDSLAIDVCPQFSGQIIDCFHETVSYRGSNQIVALSFSEAIERFLSGSEAWWLDDNRPRYGSR
jgi:hypothetical protein